MCNFAKSSDAKLHGNLNITPSSMKNLHAKAFNSDLSAHQNKAAYQTPKYLQLPKKPEMKNKNLKQKFLTKNLWQRVAEPHRGGFWLHHFFVTHCLDERGLSPPTRGGAPSILLLHIFWAAQGPLSTPGHWPNLVFFPNIPCQRKAQKREIVEA